MATKKTEVKETKVERPEPLKLTADEIRKRMQEFDTQRKENFIASIRKGKS